MALKKSELYSSLWASCNELRGGMDASQYKDYVLVLLFVKYISDRYAGEPYAPIVIPPGASFADMVALKGKPDIGDQINKKILGPLAQANHLSDMPDFNDPAKLGDGKERVERLTNLIAIFENPQLDFSKNRADGDDLLGDAYEYLMRHFATESGKSKGQFYTPAEVSRVIAQILGIRNAKTTNDTTVYDPTCGSGSLLLKVGDEARHGKDVRLSLFGQEKDNATAGLARMNMILHDYATAEIKQGNTLANPLFRDSDALKTFDYVVANPPFSDKRWSTGLDAENDPWERFRHYGIPPRKQGDYAYLLHILRSLKAAGKGACILPHGVLFRGNAEADIRRNLVQRGVIKGIIGLPPNLFFGTGIPACILMLDREGARARKGIFIIDASKGFIKEGPKNRLREQDVHKIVDTFTKQVEIPGYSRLVPVAEIADPKNDYNLNLPRYIDTTEPEDLQDIEAHLRGGIPNRDIDALEGYWHAMPGVRGALFKEASRPRYSDLKLPIGEVKAAITGHPEFAAFNGKVTGLFAKWRKSTVPTLKGFAKDGHPKALIEDISENLLATFRAAQLVDAYDVYQHLMGYWAETMQDDCYLVSGDGWIAGAQPREILQVKNKDGKLVWPESHDYKKGKRRFKSDLISAQLLVIRYFSAEQKEIDDLKGELVAIEQELEERREEQGGEDGLLVEVIEGEGDKQKITIKVLNARLREIGKDVEFADERKALEDYKALLDKQSETKAGLKMAQEQLDAKIDAKYPKLFEDEIKTLVVDEKWMAALAAAIGGELVGISRTLTGRIGQLAERYASPLSQLTEQVAALAARVEEHLQKLTTGCKQPTAKELLTGEVRLPGFGGEWEEITLGQLGEFLKGRGVRKDETRSGVLACVRYGELYTHHNDVIRAFYSWISPAVAATATRLKKGDILFAGSGETKEEIGKCAAFVSDSEAYAGGDIVILRPHEANPVFLGYFLNASHINSQKASLGQGDAVVHISSSALSSIKCRIPKPQEQDAIAEVLMDMDAELAALELRREKTRAIKQAMMQEILTGKTRLV